VTPGRRPPDVTPRPANYPLRVPSNNVRTLKLG
jgi:hypothetical protein